MVVRALQVLGPEVASLSDAAAVTSPTLSADLREAADTPLVVLRSLKQREA